jgi:HPt (histidine-containing phosphotransfer) domain-containing protein
VTDFAARMAALRARFAERCGARRGDLEAALHSGDAERVERIAHELAGNGGLFGYPELSRLAQELEEVARTPDVAAERLRVSGRKVIQALPRQPKTDAA